MPLESDVEAVRKAMSATPRTDALYYPFGRGHTTCRNVSVQEGLALAEWLERELVDATQRAEQRVRDGMLNAARICRALDQQHEFDIPGRDSEPDYAAAIERAVEQNAAGQDQAALKGQVQAAPREFTGREIREHGLDSDRFVSAWEYRALALRVGGQNIKK